LSFTEKVDVLDLLINILREHEVKLDELVARLEAVCSRCPALGGGAAEEDELDAGDAGTVRQ